MARHPAATAEVMASGGKVLVTATTSTPTPRARSMRRHTSATLAATAAASITMRRCSELLQERRHVEVVVSVERVLALLVAEEVLDRVRRLALLASLRASATLA